jgi:hypothetical protein
MGRQQHAGGHHQQRAPRGGTPLLRAEQRAHDIHQHRHGGLPVVGAAQRQQQRQQQQQRTEACCRVCPGALLQLRVRLGVHRPVAAAMAAPPNSLRHTCSRTLSIWMKETERYM